MAQGFAREDLFTVVLEHFQTDTADYADILLPATTQLEHADVHLAYGHLYMVANNPAIAPLGEAKPNTEIFRLLAARMGLTSLLCRDRRRYRGAGVRPGRPARRSFRLAGAEAAGLEQAGDARTRHSPRAAFPTPSGKCEFYSAAHAGAMASTRCRPTFRQLRIGRQQSRTGARYPLAMISPPARNFLNSTFVNVQSLREHRGRAAPRHPSARCGRARHRHGDRVRIRNDRGAFDCKRPRDRQGPAGAGGRPVDLVEESWRRTAQNANEVTSQRLTDMGRAPTFYDVLVEVEKATEKTGNDE